VAALSEPCAISLHGLNRAGVAPGQRVLVIGAGTIGLFAALVARDAGASHIGITARYPQQAAAARSLGVQEVIDPADVGPGSAAASGNWDLVVETVGGSAPTLQQAIDLAARGGKVLLPDSRREDHTTRVWLEIDDCRCLGYTIAARARLRRRAALLQLTTAFAPR
jgi:threonine dehydrogenase-like Zn-dependent dehydrogenase